MMIYDLPEDLTDRAAVKQWQVAVERKVMVTADLALEFFADTALRVALRDRLTVGEASFEAAWHAGLRRSLTTSGLPARIIEYVERPLQQSGVAELAYAEVRDLVTTAEVEAWAASALESQLRDLFEMPQREMHALEAAGARSWRNRLKGKVRTAITGFDGALMTAALRATRIPYKVWNCTQDERTRPSHRAADGQTVKVTEPFIVDGVPLQWPGERMGPIDETGNCRCWVTGSRTP